MDMTLLPTYHKINSVFKRDPENNHKTFLMGEWADDAFDYLQNMPWVPTEKVDGTNMRLHIQHPQDELAVEIFGADSVDYFIGGRTENAQIPDGLFEHMHEIGSRATKLDLVGLSLYGEGYGAGIQSGGYYRPDKGFILFDVMVTESGIWLERENVEDIARKLEVPFVWEMPPVTLNQAINHFSSGQFVQSNLTEREAEGWVLRPATELRNRRGERVITKLKVADFPNR